MAAQRGESVAFSALYASNLRLLSQLVVKLAELSVTEVALAAELMTLLDTLTDPVDYDSVAAKQARLAEYFSSVPHTVSGAKSSITLSDLSSDLTAKANWLYAHLRQQEWIEDSEGFAWFNGYYDNDGNRVEGDHPTGTRMTLTGQVFALMGGIATDEQARATVRAADRYLLDRRVGGYRLNTDFGQVLLNLGRCFGFAFGHKENGAMFSHMAVMYAYALYRRGLVREGYRVLDGIYRHSQNFAVSRMYPGIPEYINSKGRGMYPYLTGSASWFLLTLLTEAFGMRGALGNLVLDPKLVGDQFDKKGEAGVFTLFAGRRLNVVYHNPAHLDYGRYQIEEIRVNGVSTAFEQRGSTAIMEREVVVALAEDQIHRVDVVLG
jgi:cellobiose phosphorylase